MHVALGERWISLFAPEYTAEEKKAFLLGTVFPDIRYLGVIKRTQTHYKGVSLEKILREKSAFKRGMFLHSYVDEYRDKIVRKKNMRKYIESKIPDNLQNTFLKLVEDQYLYNQYDWGQFRLFLTSIPEEEKAFGIESKYLMQWHTMLTVYFTAMPSSLLSQFGFFDKSLLMLDADTVKIWSQLLPQYTSDPLMQAYINLVMSSFENELAQYAKAIKPQKQAFFTR